MGEGTTNLIVGLRDFKVKACKLDNALLQQVRRSREVQSFYFALVAGVFNSTLGAGVLDPGAPVHSDFVPSE